MKWKQLCVKSHIVVKRGLTFSQNILQFVYDMKYNARFTTRFTPLEKFMWANRERDYKVLASELNRPLVEIEKAGTRALRKFQNGVDPKY
jgi:hypothetical protein